MHRSKLKNLYNKFPTELNEANYKKQRNLCTNLLRKEKKKFYNDLDLSVLSDSIQFWRNIKLLLSDKQCKAHKNIVLVETDEIITKDVEVAAKFNNFFINSIENLDIKSYIPSIEDKNENLDDIMKQYENHPSVLKIKEHVGSVDKFKFTEITVENMNKEIGNLDPRKVSVKDDIPAKGVIKSKYIVSEHLANIYNNSIKNHFFPKS